MGICMGQIDVVFYTHYFCSKMKKPRIFFWYQTRILQNADGFVLGPSLAKYEYDSKLNRTADVAEDIQNYQDGLEKWLENDNEF